MSEVLPQEVQEVEDKGVKGEGLRVLELQEVLVLFLKEASDQKDQNEGAHTSFPGLVQVLIA